MKIKRIKGRQGNPITYLTNKVPERCVKIHVNETISVPDDVGYEMLKDYADQLVKIEDDNLSEVVEPVSSKEIVEQRKLIRSKKIMQKYDKQEVK